jgi:hypothetical protein
MSLEKPSIGGTMVPLETFEAFADIPQNRVLMAEKLTAGSPVKPEIVEGLTTIEQVFEHFKPKIEMEFETEEGTSKKENLNFSNLGDFGVKGITAQSNFLLELTMKKEQYQKIIKQLKANKQLKQAISDAEMKQSLINSLQVLIKELQEAR